MTNHDYKQASNIAPATMLCLPLQEIIARLRESYHPIAVANKSCTILGALSDMKRFFRDCIQANPSKKDKDGHHLGGDTLLLKQSVKGHGRCITT
jgi:hypothetical protein